MNTRWIAALALAATSMAFAPGAARAEPVGTSGSCALADLSLTIGSITYAPVACRQPVDQTPAGVSQTTTRLNTAFGTSFEYLDKSDAAGSSTAPINLTVTASGTTSGTWGVSWTENAAVLPDLPMTVDLIVGVFGGQNGAGYYFDDLLLTSSPNSGSGLFTINFLNSQGTNTPGLSHLHIIGGDFTAYETPPDGGVNEIPEPATLALFGLGLAGLGVASRRRRKA